MKNILLKSFSIMISCIILFHSFEIITFANESSDNADSQSVNQLIEYDDFVVYTYADNNIAYCAQITYDGLIQFSYVQDNGSSIVMSDSYSISEITNELSLSSWNYHSLNTNIIQNIDLFENTTTLTSHEEISSQPGETRGYSTLGAAILGEFGSNYSGTLKQITRKSYNGTSYWVRCTESQTTSYTTPDAYWFAKDTALTAVVAWAISGGWSFQGAIWSIVASVVSTVVVNGVTQTLNNFTAQRSDVSLIRTRIVTVDGYSTTQYWAGWTRKYYFFKGDEGWRCDSGGYHYNVKHSDYDDLNALISQGFQNFIDYTL